MDEPTSEDVITVTNLWKTFRIPHEKRDTFFESIKGIFKRQQYEELVALRDINFTVKKGDVMGIIGANGSGKSTLLSTIANIIRPTKGSVKVNGKITPFLALGVGFHPDFTARENIYIYSIIMGLSKKEISSKIDNILNFAELKRFEDTKLKNFSSGMHVRLAFATAVQTHPDILLLDEILAVGDATFQQKCFDIFKQYIKEKKTIVLVSHNLGVIGQYCNKVLFLRHGEQIAFGDAKEVVDKYLVSIGQKTKPEIKQEVKNKIQ